MSSLVCKCVFYRPQWNAKGGPMELNFEGLEMQKWDITADIARSKSRLKKWGQFSSYYV